MKGIYIKFIAVALADVSCGAVIGVDYVIYFWQAELIEYLFSI